MELLAGVFMPLRFIVYQRPDADRVFVSFLRPSAFARGFSSPPLTAVALALEKDMTDVLEEMFF